MRIAIGGFQHETNTFAPSKATYENFVRDGGWVRIQATVLEANLASRRVLDKCGFAFEGTLRNLRIVRGRPSDFLLYATVPD